jgi:hypothetical protein
MMASESKCWKISQCDFRFNRPNVIYVIELYEGFRFVNYEVTQREKAKSFDQSMENLACFDSNF